MSIKTFFTQFFTWWNSETMGTRFYTWRVGKRVGEDEQGNVYYEGGSDVDLDGRPRRWVIYKGLAEASRIPPGWHGWIHHRTDVPPSKEDYKPREWQKPHLSNLTGSPQAYRPPGSLAHGNHRPQVTGDYDAWTPGG